MIIKPRYVFLLITILAFLIPANLSIAATMTIDVSAKKASADSDSIQTKLVRVIGEQVGFTVSSTTQAPQKYILKLTNIKDVDYDIYVNGSYAGWKPAQELRNGIERSLSGGLIDPLILNCLSAQKKTIDAEHKRLQKLSGSEIIRAKHTISQAQTWTQIAFDRDKAYRSEDFIIAPKDSVLRSMTFQIRTDADGVLFAARNACDLTQMARDRMYLNLKDINLRDSVVAALTPIELSAAYSNKNGKPHIDVKLTSSITLPASGNITVDLPEGWQPSVKNLSFSNLKPGETQTVSFDLISDNTEAKAPDSVPITAAAKIKQDTYEAWAKFKTTASMIDTTTK